MNPGIGPGEALGLPKKEGLAVPARRVAVGGLAQDGGPAGCLSLGATGGRAHLRSTDRSQSRDSQEWRQKPRPGPPAPHPQGRASTDARAGWAAELAGPSRVRAACSPRLRTSASRAKAARSRPTPERWVASERLPLRRGAGVQDAGALHPGAHRTQACRQERLFLQVQPAAGQSVLRREHKGAQWVGAPSTGDPLPLRLRASRLPGTRRHRRL